MEGERRKLQQVDTGDEVTQRGASDSESVVGDEFREPRRRNSSSDPTSLEMKDHLLTSFRSWCAACVQGRGGPERDQGEGRKEVEDCSNVPVVSLDYCSHGARNRISEAEMEQRGDNSVLVMPDGMTKSNFPHLILAK